MDMEPISFRERKGICCPPDEPELILAEQKSMAKTSPVMYRVQQQFLRQHRKPVHSGRTCGRNGYETGDAEVVMREAFAPPTRRFRPPRQLIDLAAVSFPTSYLGSVHDNTQLRSRERSDFY
jgi:hypothetical protein